MGLGPCDCALRARGLVGLFSPDCRPGLSWFAPSELVSLGDVFQHSRWNSANRTIAFALLLQLITIGSRFVDIGISHIGTDS